MGFLLQKLVSQMSGRYSPGGKMYGSVDEGGRERKKCMGGMNGRMKGRKGRKAVRKEGIYSHAVMQHSEWNRPV